ncbi:hypothetical protein JCM10449v2_005383 [Rhodotorula kratochvilovae]
MAAGSKRSAPADFDSRSMTDAPFRRSAPSTRTNLTTPVFADAAGGYVDSTSNGEVLRGGAAANAWMGQLERRIDAAEEVGGGGEVVFGTDEARGLLEAMQETVAGFLEAPATKGDILQLMAQLSRVTSVAPTPYTSSFAPRSPTPVRMRSPTPAPPEPSLFEKLPFDVLRLILLELRDVHCEEAAEESIFSSRHGLYSWWQSLCWMAKLSRNCKEACHALYRAELVIVDVKQIPDRLRYFTKRAHRGQALRRMTMRTYDFETAFGRSSEDAGFALPDLIQVALNLTSLCIASDRTCMYGSGPFARGRRFTFDTLTGGVSVPATIVSSLSNLRTLVYGAPCSLADVVAFASELPSLESLDVLGDIDHSILPAAWKTVSRSLRRLWLPSTALDAADLGALLGVDDTLLDGERAAFVNSLAFAFDPEDYFAPQPPSDDIVHDHIALLAEIFGLVGADLRELAISTPLADGLENGISRIRIGGGPGGAPGGIPPGGVFFAMIGGGGAGGGAGGGQNAPGAGPAGGAAAPPAPGAGAPPAVPARGAAGAAGGAPAPAPGAAPAPAPNNAPNVPFNPFNPATWVFPPGGGAPAAPAEPFFETLLQHTPHLEHLELYGRRYTEAVVARLRELPLRHLALSVPDDAHRPLVVEALLDALAKGSWNGLRRIELSGRGGEWDPAQRRQIKREAEKRARLVYKSTDVKN